MTELTPEQEALYALEWNVPRSDLPTAVQLAYDQLRPDWEQAQSAGTVPDQVGQRAKVSGDPLELPPAEGRSWTSDRLAISREWVAFKEVTFKVPWKVIPYQAVSSVRPASGGGIAISRADGVSVMIDETVLGSLEACDLLAEGLSTNPAVAPAASELLQPYLEAARLERDSSPGHRHTVNRSGTTHSFRLHRRKHVTLGVICVAIGTACLALGIGAAFNPAAFQASVGDVLLFFAGGSFFVWGGICAFRMGVQVHAGKLIIGKELRTQTVRAADIRAITLEPKAVNQAGATHWVARAELNDGKSIWIDDFDCGTTRRPPRPELAAAVDEVRALLGVTADVASTPESRYPSRDGRHRRTG